MKEYTAARANREIDYLNNEKLRLLNREIDCCTYVVDEFVGEEASEPDYDYETTREKIAELDRKIAKLRHAIHAFNAGAILPESQITVDEAKIRLSLMGKERRRLDALRDIPSSRIVPTGLLASAFRTEQEKTGYDVEKVAADYRELCTSMADLQAEIGLVAHTRSFTVDI